MSSSAVLLRHFYYLDAELLRSFTAQLLGGVPETSEIGTEHTAGATGKAEAGLFNFLKASGELEYQFRRSASETMSLHHQVYTRFEQALERQGALVEIDAGFDFVNGWSVERFPDGSFVKIRGTVQLADYSKTLAGIEGFPDLFKSFMTVQMINIKNSADSGAISAEEATRQRRELSQTEEANKKLPIKGMVAVARTLYADGDIRVKAKPSGAPDGYVLAGTGRVDSLLVGLGAEGFAQTPDTAEWIAVGQITGASKADKNPLPTGNGLEDAIERMTLALREIVKVGNSAKFPAFEFVPLAAYREVAAR